MPSSPTLLRFVTHALLAASGTTAPSRAELATAFDARCDELRRRLHPLFGTPALSALYVRAVQLAAAEYPWLPEVLPKDHEPCSLEGLERIDDGLKPTAMAAGLAAVLAHQIALLAMLIGDDLVLPLVQDAWAGTAYSGGGRSNDDHD